MDSKVAVVTGGNKGIGFEVVKGLCKKFSGTVYLTARNEERGRGAVNKLKEQGLNPSFHVLDVTNENSIEEFAKFIKINHSGIDVLVNNAGVLDFNKPVSTYEHCKVLIDTNFMSLLTISRILYPLLRQDARVVNLSSDWGLLSNIRKQEWLDKLNSEDLTVNVILDFIDSFYLCVKNGRREFLSFAGEFGDYKVSKVALSALTFVQQREFDKDPRNISINCVHPGFVKTDMTKGMGDFDQDRGARGPLYLALDAPQSLKGAFIWHDCRRVNWDD